MAVDGIGRPPAPGLPSQATGVIGTENTTRAEFAVEVASPPRASDAVGAVDSDLVRRLELGQITREQYLDIKAEEAVAHLVGQCPTEQIELIRTALRDQLCDDPVCLRLFQQVAAEHDKR